MPKHDPYASEDETRALLQKDTRSVAEQTIDRMLSERGAWEQGAEPYAVLYKIAVELLERK